jgi:threonine/homoserine/homoserine lactone efflux protein
VLPVNVLLVFAGAALLMVLSPGPNMIYLLSRSICQGRVAGLLSLIGVAAGFLVHLMLAAFGISALLMAVPLAFEVLRWLGAVYLLRLAWLAIRPGAASPFTPKMLDVDSPRKLVLMGFLTNVLNPKVAFFYLSLLPQFVAPERGSVLAQSFLLGAIQIGISVVINALIVFTAARIAAFFGRKPFWLSVQRYVMGCVLAALAVRLISESRRQLAR